MYIFISLFQKEFQIADMQTKKFEWQLIEDKCM